MTWTETIEQLLEARQAVLANAEAIARPASLKSTYPTTYRWHILLEAIFEINNRGTSEGLKYTISHTLRSLKSTEKPLSLNAMTRANRVTLRKLGLKIRGDDDFDFETDEDDDV